MPNEIKIPGEVYFKYGYVESGNVRVSLTTPKNVNNAKAVIKSWYAKWTNRPQGHLHYNSKIKVDNKILTFSLDLGSLEEKYEVVNAIKNLAKMLANANIKAYGIKFNGTYNDWVEKKYSRMPIGYGPNPNPRIYRPRPFRSTFNKK